MTLTRDEQIELMVTAEQRHREHVARWMQMCADLASKQTALDRDVSTWLYENSWDLYRE